jgi:hypothetical protein
MSIFQKDDASETRWEYKVTTVSVSLFTYLVALISMIAVNWANIKHMYSKWWQKWHPPSNNSIAGGNAEFGPGAQADLAPAFPELETGEAGATVERWFPWPWRWLVRYKASNQPSIFV